MKDNFEFKTRKCKKSDWKFFEKIIKGTLLPYIAEYFPPHPKVVREGFERDWKEIVILIRGKRRIGFYQLKPSGNSVDIVKIFVSPSYRGKGIGKRLMENFEKLPCKKLTLQVWENNFPAKKFYERLGYKAVKKEGHKIHMEKNLNKL